MLHFDGSAWRSASRDALKVGTMTQVCAGKGILMFDKQGRRVENITRAGTIAAAGVNSPPGTYCPARVTVDECRQITEVGTCDMCLEDLDNVQRYDPLPVEVGQVLCVVRVNDDEDGVCKAEWAARSITSEKGGTVTHVYGGRCIEATPSPITKIGTIGLAKQFPGSVEIDCTQSFTVNECGLVVDVAPCAPVPPSPWCVEQTWQQMSKLLLVPSVPENVTLFTPGTEDLIPNSSRAGWRLRSDARVQLTTTFPRGGDYFEVEDCFHVIVSNTTSEEVTVARGFTVPYEVTGCDGASVFPPSANAIVQATVAPRANVAVCTSAVTGADLGEKSLIQSLLIPFGGEPIPDGVTLHLVARTLCLNTASPCRPRFSGESLRVSVDPGVFTPANVSSMLTNVSAATVYTSSNMPLGLTLAADGTFGGTPDPGNPQISCATITATNPGGEPECAVSFVVKLIT